MFLEIENKLLILTREIELERMQLVGKNDVAVLLSSHTKQPVEA